MTPPENPSEPAPRKPTLRQLKAEDTIAAYGVVDCEACGAEMTVGNMYGMGRCESCGFHRNPMRKDFQATVEEHRRRVPRPADRQAKGLEVGHVVVHVPTGKVGRVRGFDVRGMSVLVDIGFADPERVAWLVADVMLASEWERATVPVPPGRRELEARKAAARQDYLAELERLRGLVASVPPLDRAPRPVRFLADVEMAGIRTERWLGATGLIRLIPRPGPWCRIDRRLRTSPHGDALDTRVRYAVNGGRGVPGLLNYFRDPLDNTVTAPILVQSDYHQVIREMTNPWVPQRWYGVDVARDETHFTLTPLQREFLERTKGGERVIVIPARRSSGWPETFRMAEEMLRAARERAQPWWDDALAAENGMGC